MNSSDKVLSPSEAAEQLGVSPKALRLYEQRGLVTPIRTSAGWRAYGPEAMARAREVAALRALGLSLAQVASVLGRDPRDLDSVLAAHESALADRLHELASTLAEVRAVRTGLTGTSPSRLPDVRHSADAASVTFDLPWPWGGERFELSTLRALTYIVGPLGSGKTRLGQLIARSLPGAAFIGLERLADGGAVVRARLDADVGLKARVEATVARLVTDGAAATDALLALLVALEREGAAALVIDMVEQGLDRASQEALIAHLRARRSGARPLFLLTRSSAILDPAALGPDEEIIFCPANHSPPMRVGPHHGGDGREAVASCLAPPEVRARTEGMIAWLPRAS